MYTYIYLQILFIFFYLFSLSIYNETCKNRNILSCSCSCLATEGCVQDPCSLHNVSNSQSEPKKIKLSLSLVRVFSSLSANKAPHKI